MDDEQKKHEPKITIVEIIVFGLFIITADAAEALANFTVSIPGVGEILPILAWAYGFTISAFTLFWLIMKGISSHWFLGGSVIDLIPFANALPARSAAFVATIIEDRLPPKAKSAVSAVSKPTNPIKK